VIAADLNGDGFPDLVTANYSGNTVSVLLGNGDGSFKPQVTYSTGPSSVPAAVAVADFNADGVPDLVTADEGSNKVSVLLGKGDGSFQQRIDYATNGSGPRDVAVADFNRDGFADVVTADYNIGRVSLLLNAADWNGPAGALPGENGPRAARALPENLQLPGPESPAPSAASRGSSPSFQPAVPSPSTAVQPVRETLRIGGWQVTAFSRRLPSPPPWLDLWELGDLEPGNSGEP
jgi:hypothetical protein